MQRNPAQPCYGSTPSASVGAVHLALGFRVVRMEGNWETCMRFTIVILLRRKLEAPGIKYTFTQNIHKRAQIEKVSLGCFVLFSEPLTSFSKEWKK